MLSPAPYTFVEMSIEHNKLESYMMMLEDCVVSSRFIGALRTLSNITLNLRCMQNAQS